MSFTRDTLKSLAVTTGAVLALSTFLHAASSPETVKKRGIIYDLSSVGKAGSKDDKDTAVDDVAYDFVVVGGGTAGCVLASRLSEDPTVSVLLLESGTSGVALPFSVIPAGYGQLFRTEHDHNLHTSPQANAGNKRKFWPRAKLLGGCSAMNAMMFHAGAPTDYDEWAASGEPGSEDWAYDKFRHYFKKFETYVPSVLFPKVEVSHRGDKGPVQVGYFGYMSRVTKEWLQACVNVGIPLSPDFNTSAGTMGAGKIMTYINPKGQRVSTEAAYLTPKVLQRPNLTVATGAHVSRIFVNGDKASGVLFADARTKKFYRVKAKKEIVLCAGAVHTPHILMLSGIGPAAHLESHGIALVKDLPGVGQHLMDHPVVNARFRVKKGESLGFLGPAGSTGPVNIAKKFAALAQYLATGKGPFTCNIAEGAAFVRTLDETIFPPNKFKAALEDTSSSPGAPDLEIFVSPVAYVDHGAGVLPPGDLMSMGACNLRPTSLGSITLKSADPFEAPEIDPNYLATQHDVEVLARGMRLLLRLAAAEPLKSLLVYDADKQLDHDLHKIDDSEMEKVVRERCETLYHPTSSARMAPLAEDGVVDPYLRVYGVPNLRIADASIFPTIISGHTAAPAIAIGEKAADLVRHTWSIGSKA